MSPVTMYVDANSVIRVSGELDVTTAPDLDRLVADFFELADSAEAQVLTLDLAGVTACDHAGVTTLLHAQARCAEHGLALRVLPGDAVRTALTQGR
jgi:anti-anti-sigma factor